MSESNAAPPRIWLYWYPGDESHAAGWRMSQEAPEYFALGGEYVLRPSGATVVVLSEDEREALKVVAHNYDPWGRLHKTRYHKVLDRLANQEATDV